MQIRQITDPKLSQHAYLIGCERAGEAIIIDPQRDVDRYFAIARQMGLRIVAAAETHIHADYLSGLRQFAEHDRITILASGEGSADWQYNWLIGSRHDYRLLKDGDAIEIGNVRIEARHTPGHTPEHIVFVVTDLTRDPGCPLGIVSGDFVFVGDVGRPDLLETVARQAHTMVQSSKQLFDSIQDFKRLSPSMLLWPGHGAGSACGRALGGLPVSSVGYEIGTNPSLQAASDVEEFVKYILTGQPEPPGYFARMKRENRDGPRLLNRLPQPHTINADGVDEYVLQNGQAVLDTRTWEEYRGGHLPNAFHVPLDKEFSTIVGAYIEPDKRICLIAEPHDVEEAVRGCIRVGVDRIETVVTPEALAAFHASNGSLLRADEIPMSELPAAMNGKDIFLLDVRGQAEVAESGIIAGSHQIAHTQLLDRMQDLPTDADIHVYCRSGDRSRKAYGCLKCFRYRVTLVDGGVDAWKELGRPLDRIN
jgi:hydroxyacylglutathione hydrolase